MREQGANFSRKHSTRNYNIMRPLKWIRKMLFRFEQYKICLSFVKKKNLFIIRSVHVCSFSHLTKPKLNHPPGRSPIIHCCDESNFESPVLWWVCSPALLSHLAAAPLCITNGMSGVVLNPGLLCNFSLNSEFKDINCRTVWSGKHVCGPAFLHVRR